MVANWYHQREEDNNREIDPRRGRLKQRAVYSPDQGLMQREDINWDVHKLNPNSHWVRKKSASVYTFDGDEDEDTRVRHMRYFYEAQFGNLIRVEERDAADKKVLRAAETDYSEHALIHRHIGDRPSKERILDARGRCIAETRFSYDGNGNLIKSERPTTGCGETDAANLIVSRLAYDAVGNVTRSWTEGTSHDIRTEFDDVFHLFPVRRYNANDAALAETGRYYGINGDDSRADGGFWGAMQEFCAVDGVCAQQAYDEFGRASHRWEKGVGYPDRDQAQTQWRYYSWGSMGQSANVIVTQGQPRCEGNFSRKLYDGFGRLIQEQSPRQGWQTRTGGCSEVENRLETVVDYGYDGLGRLLRTSVPRPVAFDWVHEPDWEAGYSATTYDALGRPVSATAPNGSVTSHHYNGLTSSVIGGGEGERRMLSWQQQDQLGRATLLRSYMPGGDEWTLAAEISLAYDAADRLTQVYRRDGGARRWRQTSSIRYDFIGRKTGMSDADLGSWSYAYNTLGQLTRQTDARDKTSCLYYDSLGRMRGRVLRTDTDCAATVAAADLDSSYSYDPQGRVQRVANASVSRSFSYDSYSRLNAETVTIDSLSRTTSYSYDAYHRPTAVTYHGGEVVTTRYGSPGVAVGLRSSVYGDLVDKVRFDEAGRMTALRLPAAGGLWRTQSYYPWRVKRNGGMLASLKVGLSEGDGERLSRSYAYNQFGDITALTEGTTSYSFSYDGLGRLTGAYGRAYSYDAANRLTAFNGQAYSYYDAGPYHAVDRLGDFDRFDYDANGNMTKRNKGLASQQTLVWNAENRLSQVRDSNGDMVEQYWYDVGGARVKKVSGNTTTYTFFGHYEEEVTNGVTTTISHYSFGGLRVAVKRGSTLYHLHGDHLGSTSLTTAGSVVEASRAYYAYGSERAASGDLKTDRTFTGQKRDATGLLYYNARYYDPALGTFISPDSLVPDASRVIDYNRFLYARGNPLKYSDPTGHNPLGPEWVEAFKAAHGGRAPNAQDRADRLASLATPGGVSGSRSWTDADWKHYANNKRQVLTKVVAKVGIKTHKSWDVSTPTESDNFTLLAEGVVALGHTVGEASGDDVEGGLARVGELLDGPVNWVRAASGYGTCKDASACALGRAVTFYDKLFEQSSDNHIRATAVHEMAHVIHNTSCGTVMGMGKACEVQLGTLVGVGFGLEGLGTQVITQYGETNQWEYWAEAVTDWVYKDLYMPNQPPPQGKIYRTTDDQRDYIIGVFK